jgi:hypothetical protein
MGNQWGARRRGSRGKRRVTSQRTCLIKPWLANTAVANGSKVVVKKNISFDDYKNCVLNDTPTNVKTNAIRTVKMMNYSLTQNKLALSNKDDNRVWFDKTSSRAYGHFRN